MTDGEIELWKSVRTILPSPLTPARSSDQPALFDMTKGPGVYIHSDGTAIKIGKTATAERQRRRSHQTGNPRDIVLLAWIPGANERTLHKRFAHLNIRGEWFRMDSELMTFVQAWRLVEAAFD